MCRYTYEHSRLNKFPAPRNVVSLAKAHAAGPTVAKSSTGLKAPDFKGSRETCFQLETFDPGFERGMIGTPVPDPPGWRAVEDVRASRAA